MANVKVSGQTHKHTHTQTDPDGTKTICPHDLRFGGIKIGLLRSLGRGRAALSACKNFNLAIISKLLRDINIKLHRWMHLMETNGEKSRASVPHAAFLSMLLTSDLVFDPT